MPILKEFAIEGNNNVRSAAAKCIARVFQYQHHVPAREDLLDFVMKRLAKGKSFSHRRTYITFCEHVVGLIPFMMFKELFSEKLLSMNEDPIPRIRQDLAEVLIVIKPYFDRTEHDAYIITELIQKMMKDPNQDVAETAEHAEFEILQNRKKVN